MGKKSKTKSKTKNEATPDNPAILIEHIVDIVKSISENHAKSNALLEIFTASQNEDEGVVTACCTAFKDIFSHFISTTKFLDVKIPESEKASEQGKEKKLAQDSEDIFRGWLLTQYFLACDILYDFLSHESPRIQYQAMDVLAVFLETHGKHKSPATVNDSKKIMESIMSHLLSPQADKKELIHKLPSVLSVYGEGSDELALFALQCLKKKHISQFGQNPSDLTLSNCWSTIGQITASTSPPLGEKSRNLVTAVVCQFLRYKMPVKLYKDILTEISQVMTKMSSPIRLADFLTESFSIGGAISLMSLNALFILMHQYNLNYPDFYGKLYSMFQPQIFGAKYRSRFFHLADLFLTSTHLPSYLVAAFAKRLARLCLHAPASGVQLAVPFILNLLQRHPACQSLIHKADVNTDFDKDPFLEEASLVDCRALDSCLWELQTLERHFDPSVGIKARKRTVREEDLANYLGQGVQDIIESEAKKIKQNVPVTFEKCTSLDLPNTFIL